MLTIISGGQTGVDQVALDVARACGFPTGGTAPLGYRTDAGPMPDLLKGYGLKESWSPGYRVRTIQNVQNSDATVWFGDETSPGGILTLSSCERFHKQYWTNPAAADLYPILHDETRAIRILNVAGNRIHNLAASLLAAAVLRPVLIALRDAQIR